MEGIINHGKLQWLIFGPEYKRKVPMWQLNCLQQQVKNQLRVVLNQQKFDFKRYPILNWNYSIWTSIPSKAFSPVQKKVKRKINIENDFLVGLYRNRDVIFTKWPKRNYKKV